MRQTVTLTQTQAQNAKCEHSFRKPCHKCELQYHNCQTTCLALVGHLNKGTNATVMAHTHCSGPGTGMGTGTGCNVHIAVQGMVQATGKTYCPVPDPVVNGFGNHCYPYPVCVVCTVHSRTLKSIVPLPIPVLTYNT